MNTIKDGGPAFPRPQAAGKTAGDMAQEGMTLREYAAIHADMGKIEVNSMEAAVEIVGRPFPEGTLDQAVWQFDLAWKLRFMSADAMLRAREVQS
jgi:hypothetical protein